MSKLVRNVFILLFFGIGVESLTGLHTLNFIQSITNQENDVLARRQVVEAYVKACQNTGEDFDQSEVVRQTRNTCLKSAFRIF